MHIRANPVKFDRLHEGKVVQVLWKLSEWVPYTDWSDGETITAGKTDHIQTSSSTIPGVHETFVFACDNKGKWLTGREQAGSHREIDHAEALAGFLASVVPVPN
jgi:hypothetical protein